MSEQNPARVFLTAEQERNQTDQPVAPRCLRGAFQLAATKAERVCRLPDVARVGRLPLPIMLSPPLSCLTINQDSVHLQLITAHEVNRKRYRGPVSRVIIALSCGEAGLKPVLQLTPEAIDLHNNDGVVRRNHLDDVDNFLRATRLMAGRIDESLLVPRLPR